MKGAWILLACLYSTVALGQINSLPSQPHLLVKGEASRTVLPDRFSIKVALKAVDLAPERAREQVERNASMVLASMKKQGALKDSVDASILNMSTEQRFEAGKMVFKGTRVTRTLSAEFDDPAKLQGFLATLTTSEELQISQLNASYSKDAALHAELKREAAQQTRDSAEGLARTYGAKIAGLYTISDVAPSFAYGVQAGTWPSPKRAGSSMPPPEAPAPLADIGANVQQTSLSVGEITLSENVYAVFLIAQ